MESKQCCAEEQESYVYKQYARYRKRGLTPNEALQLIYLELGESRVSLQPPRIIDPIERR